MYILLFIFIISHERWDIIIKRTLNIIGETYGDFTVKEMIYKRCGKDMRAYCKCLGIDGKEYIIRTDALRSGATKHIKHVCNKRVKNDLTGKKFSNVTVIEDTGIRDSQGHVKWHCLCDCGQEFDTYGTKWSDYFLWL